MPESQNAQRSASGPGDAMTLSEDPSDRSDAARAASAAVLLVEDDFLLRTVSMGTLSDLGYRAYEVPDAQQALSLLADNNEIKILITDVNLPGMDGKALAAEARRLRPEIRVLFVTGYSQRIVKDVDMRDGATGYLSKPFQHQDLDRALRQLLL